MLNIRATEKIEGRAVKGRVSDKEWALRVELAACYRLLAFYDMTDLHATHVSVRVPGEKDSFLLNPFGYHFDEITASGLVKIDIDGNVLEDELGAGVNTAGFVIHGAVHDARHDINCVIHTHTPAGMAVSCHAQGLMPLTQHAAALHGRVGYHIYEGISLDRDERERLASDLGQNMVMILHNHGLLACGRSIPEAFQLMMLLEMACKAQIGALAAGPNPIMPSDAALQVTAKILSPETAPAHGDERGWAALLRKVERLDPGYKD